MTTRWTSHDRALTEIFEKYKSLVQTLQFLQICNDSDRDLSSKAKGLKTAINSYTFVITMIFVQKYFQFSPLFKYLQTKNLDFIQALALVDDSKKRLQSLRTDKEYLKLVDETKLFVNKNNVQETEFKVLRTRRRKVMPGELAEDEVCL